MPILSLLIGCADPKAKLTPGTASATQTQPDTALASGSQRMPDSAPVSQGTLPSGYTLTDTTSWGNMLEDGQRALLRRGGVTIDTVDLNYGVAAVGEDSLVFLPVRTDSVPLPTTIDPSYESFPTQHVLWTPTSRRELRTVLPFFNADASSPTIPRESVIHYWGVAAHDKTNRIYAMRYNFRTARLDSLYLNREDSFATDYRYHLGTPQVHGNEVSFDGIVLDASTWRVIRQDPSPR